METKIDKIEIEGITYVPENSLSNDGKVIELNGDECPYVIGKNYLVRTVTMIQLGKLIQVTDKELVLSDGSWIGDTGRFSEALSNGESALNEVELINGNIIVSRGAVCDVFEWKHDLPTKTK